jgi:hypothetical protein
MLLDQIAMNTGPSWHLDVCLSTRANLLMIGPADVTAMLLDIVRRHLEAPVATIRAGEPLTLPQGQIGTLIVQNLCLLSATEQTQLNEALNGDLAGTQVISTSAICPMPMVENGRFLDILYYRLNTIYVDVRDALSGL